MSEAAQTVVHRFNPYPAHKDSGVEWLGEIPADWDSAKMWRISTAASGGTPSMEAPEYWDGAIPWVSPKDMKRRFIDSSEDSVTERALAETGIKLVEPPVVLIVVRGMILAHSFPVAITTVPVTINQDMKALRFRHDVDPAFIAWLFEGAGKALLGAVVEEAAHGTRAIRMDQWRSVCVPLPPSNDQRVIAAFLDRETARIDALVAKKERLIELFQEKRTALITRAVTEGLDPNVPMKDSGVEWLGEIPAHWNVARLKQHIPKIEQGWSPLAENRAAEAEEWAVLKVGCVNGGRFDETQNKALPSTIEPIPELEIHDGDVLVSRANTRELLGSAALVVHPRQRLLLCDKLYRLSIDVSSLLPAYAVVALAAGSVRYQLEIDATGASNSMQNISQETMRCLVFVLPRLEEQAGILEYLDRETEKIDALAAKVRDAIDRLKELRTTLISAAVTGKIDVRQEVA